MVDPAGPKGDPEDVLSGGLAGADLSDSSMGESCDRR